MTTNESPPGSNSTPVHPRNRIRGVVASAYARVAKPPVAVLQVNEETKIPDELVSRILEDVGDVLDLRIPMCSKPRHGWRVSTLVGYIFERQHTFQPR